MINIRSQLIIVLVIMLTLRCSYKEKNEEYKMYSSDINNVSISIPAKWLDNIEFYEDKDSIYFYLSSNEVSHIPYCDRLVGKIVDADEYFKSHDYENIKNFNVNGKDFSLLQNKHVNQQNENSSKISREILESLEKIELSPLVEGDKIKTFLFEYGDFKKYIDVSFNEFDREIVIEYILKLNGVMDNAKVELKEMYESDRYLIFEVNRVNCESVEETHLLAWEKGKQQGGVIVSQWDALVDGYLNDKILVTDSGTYVDRMKWLYDMSKDRNNLFIGFVYTLSELIIVPNTNWIMYEGISSDFCDGIHEDFQSEIAFYNPYLNEKVIYFKTGKNGMWSFEKNKGSEGIYDVYKSIATDKSGNVIKVKESEINLDKWINIKQDLELKKFDDCKFKWNFQNFESENICIIELLVREKYLHTFDIKSFKGNGTILTEIDEKFGIVNDIDQMLKIDSEDKTVIVYGVFNNEKLDIKYNEYNMNYNLITSNNLLLEIDYNK